MAPEQTKLLKLISDTQVDGPAKAILSTPEAVRARTPDEGPNIYYGPLPVSSHEEDPQRDVRWHCASRLELDFTPSDWVSALAITQAPLQASANRAAVVIPFRAKRSGIRALVADDNKLNHVV